MANGIRRRTLDPAKAPVSAMRGITGVVLLTAVVGGAVVPLGCATGGSRESVWVQIIPGRYFTFRAVKGETDGETLFIKGKIEAVGYFERDYVPYIVTGRGPGGEIVVEEESGRWMKRRSETFFMRVPYQPNVDYTIRAGREGLVSKLR